jgi:sensor histidine kinase regulating citrate/malate metabolism
VYTKLLYVSRVVVIGILTTGLTSVFYYFLVAYFNELTKGFEMQNQQNVLAVQISALQARTETMKQAEKNAIIHRHDLRHHLNLINGYLLEGNITDAQNYIIKIEKNIDNTTTIQYCDNNAANLVLSSYINMAKSKGIDVISHVCISKTIEIADMDLCVILANAIENAINACVNIKEVSERKISISCKSKNNKLFIEIVNSFVGTVQFEGDMPVTNKDNHGFGTKSIVTAIEKYQGIYSFVAKDNIFTLSIII